MINLLLLFLIPICFCLRQSYVGDVGICEDSSVVFCEQFLGDVGAVKSRWSSSPPQANIRLLNDLPVGLAIGKLFFRMAVGARC
jgi:hypothetical protein